MYAKLKSSRKRPKIQYWFYVGSAEENGDRDKDGVIDAVDDMQDIVNLLIEKKDVQKSDLVFTIDPNGHHDWSWWSAKLPDFLIWAFGK
jgi:S-formylglutathione hydrolase FrmB